MTLAVVAHGPWPADGIRSAFLIFAADTRWTFPGSGRAAENWGQKLRPMTADMGAVFAGDVLAAEEGLQRFEERIRLKRPIQSRQELLDLAQEQFVRVFDAHVLKRTQQPPGFVSYLIGTRYPTGDFDVIHFESSNGFIPKSVAGVNAIGWPSAAEKFRSNLVANSELRRSQGGITGDSMTMGMHIASSLSFVVDDDGEESVGGGVHWAILDEDGWRTMEIDISDDGESWNRITLNQSEVQGFTKRYRVPCLSSGHPDVGLIHIFD